MGTVYDLYSRKVHMCMCMCMYYTYLLRTYSLALYSLLAASFSLTAAITARWSCT